MADEPEDPAARSRSNQAGSEAWLQNPMSWPFAAARLALETGLWWMDQQGTPTPRRAASNLAWTTPNRIALELATFRLRDFSNRPSGIPGLICAPYALHRALLADFAPGHSIVEALKQGGIGRLFLTDWNSASAAMRYLSIDNYLAELNVAVDQIGPPLDLIGLCQGGWMSLLYAARFPEKVRRLVLVGAPVDLSVESDLSRMVAHTSPQVFDALVTGGGGLMRGTDLMRLWRGNPDLEAALQKRLGEADPDARGLRQRFAGWHAETLDLPGAFYLEIVNHIFRQNRLARGTFVALGRALRLSGVATPVYLLAGRDDEIVPPAQALATAALLGTPSALVTTDIAPSTHLGLFIGADTIASAWPRIAAWLSRDAHAETSPSVSA